MEDKLKMSHRGSKMMDRLWKAEEGRQKMAGAQQLPPSPKSPYQPQAGLISKNI